jgi:hypothetical protein
MPICRKCQEDKIQSDFQFHRVSGKYYQTCRRCRQLQQYAWNAANRDEVNKSATKWRKKNPEKEWRVTNPEAAKACMNKAAKEWHKRNPMFFHEYYKANKAQYVANRAKRRATQNMATPKWLSDIHKTQIVEQYEIAKAKEMQTGVKQHVDHIVPLHNPNVCGLHVPWNLQVITATENLSKGWRLICR